MMAAMVQAACEHGGGSVTVAQVVACAGVSRRTFYAAFRSCEDCLLAALDRSLARVARMVTPAYRGQARWRERIRASLTGLLWLFDEEPQLGRFLLVETLVAGQTALQRRRRALKVAIAAIEEGGVETGRPAPPLVAEGVVGAVFSVIHARTLDRGHGGGPADVEGGLVKLVNPLMGIIVLPYLGAAAARRELDRPVELGAALPHRPSANPLKDLQVRLTYRTVCTLAALAAHPGSSNRVIADAAGIADQGQVSKLLARLERLGLVRNAGTGGVRGEPNAWTLTAAGREAHSSILSESSRD